MPSEFYLEPEGADAFSAETVEAMHAHVRTLPSHQWPDRAYVVFGSDEEREHDLPTLIGREGNDYRHAIIAIEPSEVMLSAVGHKGSNRVLYDFVRWCQERWACALFEYSTRVEPEILLRAGR
ncbi:hypothetical protein AB6N24_15615 [Cellulomonas sp. 179-A 4D5 NHS]|uniref:hypothetical protein n=1 Tax=Cellulomonas sp. 179-A 4D5 NHS TaxID=3142378 RepID=UPI0039A2D805